MFIPILRLEEIRDWERKSWESGVKAEEVIERVGAEIEIATRELRLSFTHVLILAGKGNNGADALALAKSLPGNYAHTVIKVSDPIFALEEFKSFAAKYRGVKVLLFDGLFGVGLNRPLNREYTSLIREINASSYHRVSIDIPSGLDENGKPYPEAVQAHQTYTVGAAKSAFLGRDAADFTGTISVIRDVGLLPQTPRGEFQWSDWSEETKPNRRADSHKGSYGHVSIFAGSKGYHGAAVLCARGAMRAQPGLVTVITSTDSYLPIASQLQAPMVRGWEDPFELPEKTSAIVAGPGLATKNIPAALITAVQELWSSFPGPMVVDASAMEWLSAGGPVTWPRVITPHPGEAARLLGRTIAEIQADRATSLRALSSKYGKCWVVLKGHQTLIGRNEGLISVNSSGNATMSQGGTGDILAGYLGGLLSQPERQKTLEQTICYGVWKHGHAGDVAKIEVPGWVTEELVGWL